MTLNQNCPGCIFQNEEVKCTKTLHRIEVELNCGVADAELSLGSSPWATPLTTHEVLWTVGHVTKIGNPNFILSSASEIHQSGGQIYVAERTQRNVLLFVIHCKSLRQPAGSHVSRDDLIDCRHSWWKSKNMKYHLIMGVFQENGSSSISTDRLRKQRLRREKIMEGKSCPACLRAVICQ